MVFLSADIISFISLLINQSNNYRVNKKQLIGIIIYRI